MGCIFDTGRIGRDPLGLNIATSPVVMKAVIPSA